MKKVSCFLMFLGLTAKTTSTPEVEPYPSDVLTRPKSLGIWSSDDADIDITDVSQCKTKLSPSAEGAEFCKNEECSREFLLYYEYHTSLANCTPRETYVPLPPATVIEEVFPSSVLLKRCLGVCSHTKQDGQDVTCFPLDVEIRKIPARVYNARTNKHKCVFFELKEHTSCGCLPHRNVHRC